MLSAIQEKAKPKKTTDLFGGDENDDEDGDIFNASSRSATQPTKKAGGVEKTRQVPDKKVFCLYFDFISSNLAE